MSLVAYGSSDEGSESSDSEDVKDGRVSRKNAAEVSTSGYQERDDNSKTAEKEFAKAEILTVKSKGLLLPSPKNPAAQPQSSNIDSTERRTALSSFLPKPRSAHNDAEKEQVDIKRTGVKPSFALESEDEIIDIEEEYTPLSQLQRKVTEKKTDDKAKSVGSLFSLLPAPWQADKTWRKKVNLTDKNLSVEQRPKQPVKISIPSLPQHDSDEEENVDEPSSKKIRTSKGGSGLKSLLPKPKHSVTVKKDNPNRPTVKLASRPLIPHSMTKKQSKGESNVKRTPDKAKQNEQAGSDDEDMPVSFFTFHDKSSIAEEDVSQGSKRKDSTSNRIILKSEALSTEASPKVTDPSLPSNVHHSVLPTTISQDISVQQEHVASPLASESAHCTTASSIEGSNILGAMETRTYFYEQSSAKQQYEGYAGDSYGNLNYGVGSSAAVPQPNYNQDQEYYTYTYPSADVEQSQNVPQETNIDLEKLHRLRGRKNRREEINIVDVNADEQIKDSAVLLTKCGTEEVAYRPSRKKSDMPTAQQRRKHQITYLAFQAKEREQELRQQWSANRQTRRQTQSKYGF